LAIHLQITGMVQGVGYRAAFQRRARQLGLCGWVRNRSDGSVEALVEGDSAALAQIEGWARRGPPGARVAAVVSEAGNADGISAGLMEIRPSA
jgi:acylphosphatase